MNKNFSAMILAAGFGKRLLPITERIPKPLLEINGITLLDNAINFLHKLGCDQIVVNTHYKHEQIEFQIKKHRLKEKIIIIYEKNILDTGGAVKNASFLFKNRNILITNGDIFWQNNNLIDVKKMINNYKINNLPSLLLVEKAKAFGLDNSQGDFILHKNKLKRYSNGNKIFFYSGLQLMNLDYFEKIKEKKFSSNHVWDSLIKESLLTGYLMSTNLFHVGNHDGLSKVKKLSS